MTKSRQKDAASIVGDELAEDLEKKSRELVGKSETEDAPPGLVIKAGSDFGEYILVRLGELEVDPLDVEGIDLEDIIAGKEIPEGQTLIGLARLLEIEASDLEQLLPDVEKAVVKDGKYPAGDFLVAEKDDDPDTWHLRVKDNGKPDSDLMTRAYQLLYSNHRGRTYDGPDKAGAKRKLKALYKSEKMDFPAKADVEQMDGDEAQYLPLGGAISIADADAYIANAERMDEVLSRFSIFKMVFSNILESPMSMEDQLMALKNIVKEFDRGIQAVKAAVEDVYLSEAVNKEVKVTEQVETTPLLQAHSAVEEALGAEDTQGEEKVAAVQKALTAYAQAAEKELTGAPPEPTQPQNQELGAIIARSLSESLAPFMEAISQMNARLAAQSEPQPVLKATIPQQKSLTAPPEVNDPQAQQVNQLPISPITGKPSMLRAVVNRSVGLPS